MKQSQPGKQSKYTPCSSKSMKMLGDFWTLSIIDSLNSGEKRFSQLEKSLENCNPVTLSNRLKKLEADGMIERREETVDKLSVVYSLTKKGKGIIPILRQIQKFADSYL
jgi:DNA-binding HxlR family transcriptional regulator